MTSIDIYRSSNIITSIDIDEDTIFHKKLMGDWYIECQYVAGSILPIQIGDFITYEGENYFINRLPDIEKVNNITFKYTINFESDKYHLQRKLYISSDGLADFSLNGTIEDFLDLLIVNINSIYSGWTKGEVDESDPVTMQFSNETCHDVLTRIAEEFDMEFIISGKEISIKKLIGNTTAITFEYGKNLGLYNITRKQVSNQNIVTRVYGFGGDTNIQSSYRSGIGKLVFDNGGIRYIDKNTDVYGIIEGQFTNDEIYPHRTGTISAYNMDFDYGDNSDEFNANTSYIEDSLLDFDINDYLISGTTAKIVFKTGDLAGIECEIKRYDDISKRIYFYANTDTGGYSQPNSLVYPKTGDTYTLVDIYMPQEYITDAENLLQESTQEYLNENCVPQVVYEVDIDPKFMSDKTINIGDKVTVKDDDIGINNLIRISGIEFPLVTPNKITATIADFVPYTLQERIIKGTVNNRRETVYLDRRSVESSRRASIRQNKLKELIFDTEGYFDPTNIKPFSIETNMLSVGVKSSDFWLKNIIFKPNYLGDINRFYAGTGSLIHMQLEISGVGYTWVISSALDQSSLVPESAYYLYARCSKTTLVATWILSTSQITVESETGYYNFLCGVLFAVTDGYRDYDGIYGVTYINGNTIKTGTISSINGYNYINLTDGTFRFGGATKSLDYGVTTPNTLTLKGALVQSPGGATANIMVNRGVYNASSTYYIGEQVTYGGSTWNWINVTPSSGHTPEEGIYWTLASSGANGSDGLNAYLRYSDNAIDDTPATPTGDGTTGEWHATPALSDNWMSTKVAATASDGTWGTPLLIKGSKGDIGAPGANGISIVFKGSYASVSALVIANGTPQNGWSYHNTTDNKNYVYYSPDWVEFTMGADGSNAYLHIAWAINATGSAFSITWFSQATYIGVYSDNTLEDSTDYLDYVWTRIAGEKGSSPVFRGVYDSLKTYYGTSVRVDIVEYPQSSGTYYVAKATAGTFSDKQPNIETTYWDSFGGSFESIATGLLFAAFAWVEKLGVRFLQTAPDASGKRLIITGNDESADANTLIFENDDNDEVIRIDDNLEKVYDSNGDVVSSMAGIQLSDPVTGKKLIISASGVFNNKGGVQFLPSTTGRESNGSIVGLLTERNTDVNGYSAAIVGIDQTSTGNSKSLAAFFSGLIYHDGVQSSNGFAINDSKVFSVPDTNNVYLSSNYNIFIGDYKTTNRVWFLPNPADYEKWETITILNYNSYNANIFPLSGDYINGYTAAQRNIILTDIWSCVTLVSNGVDMWIITSLNGTF